MGRILRFWRDAVGTAGLGRLDPTIRRWRTCRRLETLETRPHAMPRIDAPGHTPCRRGQCGVAFPQPLARQSLDRVVQGIADDALGSTGIASPLQTMTDHITNRTAVYGPVRTVVWERLGRKDRPYPDPAFQLWEGVTPSIASPGP